MLNSWLDFPLYKIIAVQAAEASASVPVLPLWAPGATEDQSQAPGQAGGPVDQSGHR
jgi:hypothetical protein